MRKATTDVPCAVLGPDLLAAYPSAKVILTNRPVDSWIKSMRKTIFMFPQWPSFRILRYRDNRFYGPWFEQLSMIFDLFCNGQTDNDDVVRQAYLDHYENLKRLVPKERLLIFKQPYRWEPLCEFLGVERPPGEYPVTNDTKLWVQKAYGWRRRSFINASLRLLEWSAAFAAAWIAYQSRVGRHQTLSGSSPVGAFVRYDRL